jgi:3-oxoacyl-[acyl-carrier-protein] synthase II
MIWRYPFHRIAASVAREFDLAGPNLMIAGACAAGNYALAHAFDLVRMGRADVMLAGGATALSRVSFSGFARVGALAPDRCQPFDFNRKGTIPAEGSAALVLESLERPMRRGARIYAEIVGYGFACDAYNTMAPHPEGDGAARAMEKALRHSGLVPQAIGYISAHGTGTRASDRLETLAIKRVFGESAYSTPISSIKSMLGHTEGAASAIEAAACALVISEGIIPPTVGLETPDPECDLDYVSSSARCQQVEVAMNNAYGFGGYDASLILKACRA